MPPDDQAADRLAAAREWQERSARRRRMADLVRSHETEGRLAALAYEIEQQMGNFAQIATIADERKRHSALLREACQQVAGLVRSDLFFAKQLLRDNSYSAEALREESRLCREEARAASAGSEQRLAFAEQAAELAQLAAAISRQGAGRAS